MSGCLSAAELRRQKILQNGKSRLDLLIGVKNTTLQEDASIQIAKVTNNKMSSPQTEMKTALHSRNTSIINENRQKLLPAQARPIQEQPLNQTPLNSIEQKCKFNGYSNIEIILLFLIALMTSVLFFNEMSNIIFHNALFPFFSFEFAHFLIHFKHLPATSSQFQMFTTLLRLCGISQKSLKNLMIIFNCLFIFVDNFVIYLVSFISINVLINFFTQILAS